MNYIKFNCIFCGQHMEAEGRFALRQLQCPACNGRIVIPSRGERRNGARLLQSETWDTLVPPADVSLPTRYEPAIR